MAIDKSAKAEAHLTARIGEWAKNQGVVDINAARFFFYAGAEFGVHEYNNDVRKVLTENLSEADTTNS